MLCPECGQALKVHLLDHQTTHYCIHCHYSGPGTPDRSCPWCHLTYTRFRRTGLLGCSHCYVAFAERLESLMMAYHGHVPGAAGHQTIGQRARAGSQELCEYVRHGQLPGSFQEGTGNDGWPEKDRLSESAPHPAPIFMKAVSDGGPEIAIRLRLARNFEGLQYDQLLQADEKKRLDAFLLSPGGIIASLFSKMNTPDPGGTALLGPPPGKDRLQATAQRLRQARSQISPPGRPDWRAYTGDEDHIRIDWRTSFRYIDLLAENYLADHLLPTLQGLRQLDQLLAPQYHASYGFLTASPLIAGAGIRISAELYLPRLIRQNPHWVQQSAGGTFELRAPGREDWLAERDSQHGRLVVSHRYWGVHDNESAKIRSLAAWIRQVLQWEHGLQGRDPG
ncbi:MAG: hypothetical protein KDK39_08255 [Leptospiraceae bacterium]|nr:hypothetical protein [Leptospiraceae bacterium]